MGMEREGRERGLVGWGLGGGGFDIDGWREGGREEVYDTQGE